MPANYLFDFIKIQIFEPMHLSRTAKGRIFVDILSN